MHWCDSQTRARVPGPWQSVSGKRLWGGNIRSKDNCSYAEYLLLKVWKNKNPESFHGLWTKLKWLNLITQVSQVPVTVSKTVFHPLLAGTLKAFRKETSLGEHFVTFQFIQLIHNEQTHTPQNLFTVESTNKCNCHPYQLWGFFSHRDAMIYPQFKVPFQN